MIKNSHVKVLLFATVFDLSCKYIFFLPGFSLTVPKHLEISRAVSVESSLPHIASDQTRTGNLCFPSASH